MAHVSADVPDPARHSARLAQEIREFRLRTLALDALAVSVALLVALVIRDNLGNDVGDVARQRIMASLLPIGLTWLAVMAWRGAYGRAGFGSGAQEFRAVAEGAALTAAVVTMTGFVLVVPLSRAFILTAFLVGTFLLLAERLVLRRAVRRMRQDDRLVHRVITVGGPTGVSEVVEALGQAGRSGYEVVGVCLPDGVDANPDHYSLPVLGRADEVRRMCRAVGADTVLVTRGGYGTARELRKVAWELEETDIELMIVPSVNEIAGSRIHMRPMAGLPLLHLERPQAGEAGGITKRIFDIVGATVALLMLSPVMLAVALGILLEDRGPILFRQARIGRDGHSFRCFKFRSMFIDADRKEADLRAASDHAGALWKMENDPRITRIGKHLRRYSVDELPQLLNVLRGEMSLVGPRPQQAWEVETYTDWEHRRLRVRPGMTGLWQVSGRSKLSFEEAIRLDLYYVDNWSISYDLMIMAKTVGAVFGRDGAY